MAAGAAAGPGHRAPVVVGAGIAGIACARELAAAGHRPRVYEREPNLGGRMATAGLRGRPVDVGAAYLTAHDPTFVDVVQGWLRRGLVREWTDTFHLASPEQGLQATTTGPMRYAAPEGLRSLVEDLATGLEVSRPREVRVVGPGPTVDGARVPAVVLAMADPQALELLAADLTLERELVSQVLWEPAVVLAAGWTGRCWPALDAAFVRDSAVLRFVLDDGARRGDGAPVLVLHADPVFSARHRSDPGSAVPVMLAELAQVLGVTRPPAWVQVSAWDAAQPSRPRAEPFRLGSSMVALASDGWAPRSRVEAAFGSGRALGRELADRLG